MNCTFQIGLQPKTNISISFKLNLMTYVTKLFFLPFRITSALNQDHKATRRIELGNMMLHKNSCKRDIYRSFKGKASQE